MPLEGPKSGLDWTLAYGEILLCRLAGFFWAWASIGWPGVVSQLDSAGGAEGRWWMEGWGVVGVKWEGAVFQRREGDALSKSPNPNGALRQTHVGRISMVGFTFHKATFCPPPSALALLPGCPRSHPIPSHPTPPHPLPPSTGLRLSFQRPLL
ncbi:hypothetical protein AXG93_108s1060 [Marchantia polymorpha subsp. ruderalis]|nr:hypothetical protein AXG93_108s1060 [Marchantia polymorpha subsp. ruderalis]